MTQPSAKIIADSISPDGARLTTMEVVMHRFVLAEFNTHRVFSRSSASSRAIPFHKIKSRVVTNGAYPVIWPKEKAGMQGGELMSSQDESICFDFWEKAKHNAEDLAEVLHERGLHKSLVNRLLEPFMWHTVIVTATEWDNFFWQRCHPDAQPEMKAAADAMQLEYYTNKPEEIPYGQWHTPFINEMDINEWDSRLGDDEPTKSEVLKKISVARCARVSYLNHDGTRESAKDLNLYEKLTQGQHWSPFEHVATPIYRGSDEQRHPTESFSGNFRGWKQFRKQFENENRGNFVPNHPLLTSKIGVDETIKSKYTDREP
jgi:thymidylate synthase ThyX